MVTSNRNADRREKVRRKQQRAEQRQRQAVFPRVTFEPGAAPARLVDAVRKAVEAVRREFESCLPAPTVNFLRLARRIGFPSAIYLMNEGSRQEEGGHTLRSAALYGMGDAIQSRIPDPIVEAYLPYNTFDTVYGQPDDRALTIRFRSLVRVPGPWGNAYHSRRRPTLRLSGRDLVVAFSDHAIRRICDRACFEWRSYAGSGEAFAFVDNCVFHEDATAGFGGPCFAIYAPCEPGFLGGAIAESLLGRPIERRAKLYCRIGYCPAVIEGEYLKAKTLLLPGMDGTPEWRRLWNAQLPSEERQAILACLDVRHNARQQRAPDFRAVDWFHRHGVPQVIRIDRPVFVYD